MPLHATQIIKRPLITEKSNTEANRVIPKGRSGGETLNRYSFLVDMRANKHQIKAAIAELFNVRVKKVRTQVRKGRTYRTRHGIANTGDWKRAVVELYPDDRIDLF